MTENESTFGMNPQHLDKLLAIGLDSETDEITSTTPIDQLIERPGGQVGRYKLLSTLGEGGMGIVFLAEQQEPVRRQVALKVIKPGMDSRQVIARFEAEQQALAMMDHPHVAKVYDAGLAPSGRPFFAMEHVKGISITEYCDRHKLTIEERLQLFLHVLEAIQHAHQKGIIHRDLKPSNILVFEEQDRPIPKIIDFGVAKAINQPLTKRTLYTEQGQFIGTPEYMSPEQIGSSIEDVDTRSDIYSLGIVLYELLTGTLPFTREELGQASFAEIQRIIRETDPPRPSTRLSRLGDKAKKVAERRDTKAAALTRRLHKELEWIPLMAMRKEPDRRYNTISVLADDIRNYLNGDSLIAGPDSKTYRFKKFIKRHQAIVTGLAAVLMVLLVGIIISTIFAIEAHQQKQAAQLKELSARQNLYFAHIGLAQQAWESGNVAKMVSLLDSLRPEPKQEDFRHFEWYYLWQLANAHHRTLYGHDGFVASISFSPLGDILASASYDWTIRLWDPANGKLKRILSHTDQVQSLAFSPDGKTLVSGCCDGTIRFWDVHTGHDTATISGDYSISSVIFSPDGEILAAGLPDGRVMLWNVADSELKSLPTIEGLPPMQWPSIAFSPDGHTLAVGGGEYNKNCDVLLWDIETKRIRSTLKGHTSQIRDVEFSPDGKLLATASHDKTVRLWDTCSAQVLAIGRGHEATLFGVTFSPDGQYIATASSDYTIIMRDTNLQELYHLKGHTHRVKSLSFSPDGDILASASNDRTVKLWDIKAYEKGANRLPHETGVYSLAFSPNGQILITGSEGGRARLWDTATEQQIGELKGHSGSVWSVGISHDGRMVATGSGDQTAKLWDLARGNLLYPLPIFPDEVFSIAFSPDDKLLAVGCRDRSIILWDITTKKKEMLTGPKASTAHLNFSPVSAIAFSPHGGRLATGEHYTRDFVPSLWDVSGNDDPIRLQRHMPTNAAFSVPLSHDGRLAATPSGDKTIGLWDTHTGRHITTLRGHVGSVLSAAFSPDDRILASGGEDRVVRIWDIDLGEQRAELKGHEDSITCVAFSPDGTVLATASKDQSVILWRAATTTEADESNKFALP